MTMAVTGGEQANPAFILASASPRRRELLALLDLRFSVVPGAVDEKPSDGEGPKQHALRLAEEKAASVGADHPSAWVLGADTIVVVDGDILGKPENADSARRMLRRLSGREHVVVTGFSIINRERGVCFSEAVESWVLFKELDDDEIAWYLASGEAYDKAGGYAIQGKAAFFVSGIRGSVSNVIGLPLAEVVSVLKRYDVIRFRER
jgi:septum formation protein